MIRSWTGREATALRKALRVTGEEFAEQLRVAPRTVRVWASRPGIVPRSAIQRNLDRALADAPDPARAWFAELIGMPPMTGGMRPAEVREVNDRLGVLLQRLDSLEGRVAAVIAEQVPMIRASA